MEDHSSITLAQAKLVRITKRLNQSIGYYELGMMEQAIRCIDSLDELGDLGPFRAAAEMVRAEALKLIPGSEHAVLSLETAVKSLPEPAGQSVWLALSYCFSKSGEAARAVNSMGCARGAKPPANDTVGG